MSPAFTCASAIDNLWSICSGVNILLPVPWAGFWELIFCLDKDDLYLQKFFFLCLSALNLDLALLLSSKIFSSRWFCYLLASPSIILPLEILSQKVLIVSNCWKLNLYFKSFLSIFLLILWFHLIVFNLIIMQLFQKYVFNWFFFFFFEILNFKASNCFSPCFWIVFVFQMLLKEVNKYT